MTTKNGDPNPNPKPNPQENNPMFGITVCCDFVRVTYSINHLPLGLAGWARFFQLIFGKKSPPLKE